MIEVTPTPLNDAVLLSPTKFSDDRGWFMESYNTAAFAEIGITKQFVQDNHSYSQAGALRGIHFQTEPIAQGKLVRCSAGRLWDVAVDLRHGSSTYGQWHGVELSASNGLQFWIPAGFGHGFYALEDCEMQYKCTNPYSPQHDGGVIWNDPTLNIDWPLLGQPTLSDKDAALPVLEQADITFNYTTS